MEEIIFDSNDNEFSTIECVICMENFEENINVHRIPICRHFFHIECVKGWFESKA
jgi:hypothetical protein